MKKTSPTLATFKWLGVALVLPAFLTGAAHAQYAQKNVLQPTDPIIASSANSPASEGVANAIDGTDAKYLNFDMANDAKTAGFIVTPSVGATWVTGVAILSAGDAPDRDVKEFTLEGSNDDPTNFVGYGGNWTLIVDVANIVSNNTRYAWATFSFTNYGAFKSYRWTVIHTQGPSTCCMQVAEVQMLGTALPKNVVVPTDPIIASSANSPASEGVANAIDGTEAKYLNFDMANDAKTAGFIVTPSVGATVINGITLETAGDAPDRDPKEFTVEGSNDDPTNFVGYGGNWTLIAHVSNIVSNNTRYVFATYLFPNVTPYTSYRWTVIHTQGPSTCCMQIAEVEFNGSGAPKNVVVPTDPIIASSANSPASEGVANAIDGTEAKYLNFDMANDAKTAGFIVTPSAGATAIIGIGILSAGDAPDRDVKEFTVEGSNDNPTNFVGYGGNWTLIAHVSNIVSNNTRYAWAYFYFENSAAYTSYRWTVIHTQGPSTCCMQVAEVQFLAITSQADCTKAAFVSRPTDNTPVLRGSQAQFFTSVNGPWPLQWTVNGAAVPGANKPIFTTDFIDSSNVANLYAVQIVGCQTSAPVHTVIFTPSTTESIGIQFIGSSGVNGAGVAMLTNDIAGVQQQGYWNSATNQSGATGDGTALPDALTDSSNNLSTITFSFQTSGTWGVGVGTDEPTQRLLNGVTGPTAPGTDQIFTFGNVPNGNHAVVVYSIGPPAQAGLRASYAITNSPGALTNYMTVYDSDQYKQAPGFYRSTSTSASGPAAGDFVRFDGVAPDANSNITVVVDVLDSGTRNYGVNAMQLVLNAPNPGAPPTITQNLQPTIGPSNGVVTLTVAASGNNLTYQWRKNGYPIQNGGDISGATTATLTINPLLPADVGIYSVAVFSPAGSTVSSGASVNISTYNIEDSLIGYWKFDETSGTNAANSATNGAPLPATIDAPVGPTWVAGKVGGAYSFDGQSFMFVSNYTKASSGISASAWVNFNGNSPAANVALIQNAEPSLYTQGGNGLHVIGAFEFTLIYDTVSQNMFPEAGVGVGASVFTVIGTIPVQVSGWHHVAFSADGAEVRVYVDGQLSGSAPYSGTIATPSINYLSIGARLNADTNALFGASPNPGEYSAAPIGAPDPAYDVGLLDELALWDRGLPPSEVTALYTNGVAGKPLTAIVLTAPVTTHGTLKASVTAGQITVTWTAGSLQTAPAPNGPWTSVTTTGNSFSEAVGPGAKFYRTH